MILVGFHEIFFIKVFFEEAINWVIIESNDGFSFLVNKKLTADEKGQVRVNPKIHKQLIYCGISVMANDEWKKDAKVSLSSRRAINLTFA